MEPVNRIQAFIIDAATGQLAQYLVSIIEPGACKMTVQPGRCTACEPWINYREGRVKSPPACIEPLRTYVKEGRDLSAELPITFSIPNIGIAKGMVAWLMKSTNRPAMYEAIRTNLSALFLPHSVLLGVDSARGWYFRNMEALAQKILLQLEGKRGSEDSDRRKQNVGDGPVSDSDPGGSGVRDLVLGQEEYSFGDGGPAQDFEQM